jgi:hypothetical protein
LVNHFAADVTLNFPDFGIKPKASTVLQINSPDFISLIGVISEIFLEKIVPAKILKFHTCTVFYKLKENKGKEPGN